MHIKFIILLLIFSQKAFAYDGNSSIFDSKIGSEINGWKVEKAFRNQRYYGNKYNAYIELDGNLRIKAKFYHSHSDADSDNIHIYLPEETLKSLPFKLPNRIYVNFYKIPEKKPPYGSYGLIDLVVSKIKLISFESDADRDTFFVSDVISQYTKGIVEGPYENHDYKLHGIQDSIAMKFINTAPFSFENLPTSETHQSFKKDDLKYSPLHIAINNENSKEAKLLINNGADVNATDHRGNTPLHISVQKKMTAISKLLIKNGANINSENLAGRIPLYYAKEVNELRLLIRAGNKFNQLEDKGFRNLSYAVEKENPEIVSFLIRNGIDINMKDSRDWTVLFYTDSRSSLEFIKFLLDSGINVNEKNNLGRTILHEVSWMSTTNEYVELFLKNSANPNIKDNKGKTPLHHAGFFLQRNNIDLLIEFGADVNIKDNDNKTVFDIVNNTATRSASDFDKKQKLLNYLIAIEKKE